MQLITCHAGKLQTPLAGLGAVLRRDECFTTGVTAWDALAPAETWARGSVHELLSPKGTAAKPRTLATFLARGATGARSVVFLDPAGRLYPPSLAAMGIDLARTYLLRPQTREQGLWAAAECLRCPGVGAVVACLDALSRVEARRLQLAAETGGGAGIFMRSAARSDIYAAATRWLVEPAPSEHRTVQRWRIQLVHGHGGRVGQAVYVEHSRQTHSLRASDVLADRPRLPQTRTA